MSIIKAKKCKYCNGSGVDPKATDTVWSYQHDQFITRRLICVICKGTGLSNEP